MIKNFQLFERLGYNEEVSKLAEYVWNLYKKGERVIDLKEYSENNMSIDVNKIYINDYRDDDDKTFMKILFNNVVYEKDKSIRISINKSATRGFIPSMEHELKHMYDFIKGGGKYIRIKDKKKLGPFNQIVIDKEVPSDIIEEIDNFLYIMYIIEMNEIEAYLHSDIRNYMKNKHKYKDISKYIKYSRLNHNYEYLKENDIKEIISKIPDKYKSDIISTYTEIYKEVKYHDMSDSRYKFEIFKEKVIKNIKDIFIINKEKEYTKEEIDNFYNPLIKEVEKKKKVYLRYIGRLWAYFN